MGTFINGFGSTSCLNVGLFDVNSKLVLSLHHLLDFFNLANFLPVHHHLMIHSVFKGRYSYRTNHRVIRPFYYFVYIL